MRAAEATLDDKEVRELWDRWRASGDLQLRDRLLIHYLPLVDYLVRVVGRWVPETTRPDLYTFGVLGLMDAIGKYRPERGSRFETYSWCRIRGAVRDGLRVMDWLPRGAGDRASRIIEKIVPIDFQSARNADGERLYECLGTLEENSPIEIVMIEEVREEVANAINLLPERERTIVVERYYRDRRLADIGRDLGVTESRVCQLHRRALRMLEEVLSERLSA